jgi:hypothetical protein
MTPILAAFGFDPAWMSPANFVLLLCVMHVGVTVSRELRMLRETVLRQAEELARTARGSEERATRAAAEITRLSNEIMARLKGGPDGEMPR